MNSNRLTMAGTHAVSASFNASAWHDSDSPVARYIVGQSQRCLDAYRANPQLVLEHANIERAIVQGGYGHRQIYELVQNGADALIDSPGGRIVVLLTAAALYCANEGVPATVDGVDAILSSHISMKRGSEIGRFGLGFKSVLEVSDRPEFYSRTGSFRFNSEEAASRIRTIVPDAERLPTLRIAWPADARRAAEADPDLADLMSWATTIVKLPCDPEESKWLSQDIAEFPAEFLLFSPHVGRLTLEDRSREVRREIRLQHADDRIHLEEGKNVSQWKVFSMRHVPSAGARKEAGELADAGTCPHCKQPMTTVKRGWSIYASPCSHRLGTGKPE